MNIQVLLLILLLLLKLLLLAHDNSNNNNPTKDTICFDKALPAIFPRYHIIIYGNFTPSSSLRSLQFHINQTSFVKY